MNTLTVQRSLLVCGTVGLSLWLAVGEAHAGLERVLLDDTRALLELGRGAVHGAPRSLLLNGARIRLATGHTEQPLAAVAAYFAARCQSLDGGLGEQAAQLLASERVPSLFDGVLHVEDSTHALVACFERQEASQGLQDLAERFTRFAGHGDLAELGLLRVVRLEASGTGTFFVATWNDGPVPLFRMFPSAGDAPGADLPGLPRPAGGRRVFSAWQDGEATSLAVYGTSEPADDAFAHYLAALERHGWRPSSFEGLRSGVGLAALLTLAERSIVVHALADARQSVLAVLALDGFSRVDATTRAVGR